MQGSRSADQGECGSEQVRTVLLIAGVEWVCESAIHIVIGIAWGYHANSHHLSYRRAGKQVTIITLLRIGGELGFISTPSQLPSAYIMEVTLLRRSLSILLS